MVSAIRSGPRAARSGDPSTGGTGRCPPARQEQSRYAAGSHCSSVSACPGCEPICGSQNPGFGDIGASALSGRNAPQVNSGSMKSAGAGYRSTSRTTLPAPGHRIPRTLKYLSGLVFRSDAAAGRYVVSVPDQQGYRPLGPGPCSPGRSESPARPTSRYRWCCCHPGRPECGQPHRRRRRLGHRPDQAHAHPAQ